MTFMRSRAGVSNQHVFHRSDAVVYVEGGSRTYSHAEVRGGKSGNTSTDILYWQSVFRAMAPDRIFHFKPVGSKGTLRQLAEDVRQDILQEIALKEAVFSVCPINRTTNEANLDSDIASITENFVKQARCFVRADVILGSCGKGLFDRKKWSKYVTTSKGQYGQPSFGKADLRSQVRDINSSKGGLRYELTVQTVVTKRDCFGHIIGTFLYRLFCHLVAKYSGSPNFSIVMACGVVIQHFRENLAHPRLADLQRHHEAQFAFMKA